MLNDDAFDDSVTQDELASEAVSPLGRAFLVESSLPSPIWLRGTVSTTGGGMPLSLPTAVKSDCVSMAAQDVGLRELVDERVCREGGDARPRKLPRRALVLGRVLPHVQGQARAVGRPLQRAPLCVERLPRVLGH